MLNWSEPSPPNAACPYHHCVADTPLGQIRLEWKDRKNTMIIPGGGMPWGEFIVGDNLDEAKRNVQIAWNAMLDRLVAFTGAESNR